MRDREHLEASIRSNTIGQHTERVVSQVVLREIELLQILLGDHGLLDRLKLVLCELVADEGKFFGGDVLHKLTEDVTTDHIVVHVQLRKPTFLQRGDQTVGSVVVDLVVLELEVIQVTAPVDERADELAALTGDQVVGEVERRESEFRLLEQNFHNDSHTIVLNFISR